LQQFPVNAEMLCRSGSRPTQVSGESPNYGPVAGNNLISVSVHRELLAFLEAEPPVNHSGENPRNEGQLRDAIGRVGTYLNNSFSHSS